VTETQPAIAPADTPLADLVNRDWRGVATAEETAFLHAHAEEWHDALKTAIGDILAQLTLSKDREAEIRADLTIPPDLQHEKLATHLDWRRRAAGAKFLMERQLVLAKRLAGKQRDQRFRDVSYRLRYLYREAIKAHRKAVLDSEFAPTEADVELWQVLDEYTEDATEASTDEWNGKAR
jgi:hypothetical protein